MGVGIFPKISRDPQHGVTNFFLAHILAAPVLLPPASSSDTPPPLPLFSTKHRPPHLRRRTSVQQRATSICPVLSILFSSLLFSGRVLWADEGLAPGAAWRDLPLHPPAPCWDLPRASPGCPFPENCKKRARLIRGPAAILFISRDAFRSGPSKPNQRSVRELFAGAFRNKSSICEFRACFSKEKHQNSQKWAKFMNFSFWPFFGLVCRGDS